MNNLDINIQNLTHVETIQALKSYTSFECPICLADDADVVLVTLPGCDHFFCQTCLRGYIQVQIENFKVFKIKCPQDGCSIILNEEFLKQVLDQPTFDRYKKLLIQKINNRSSGERFCPQSGCAKILTSIEDSDRAQCSCGAVVCSLCGELWHEGKECLEVLDPDFAIYARENNLKFCFMCKTVVNRVEGCTHITCPVCDYEWCWTCGREYKENHEIKCLKEWKPLPPAKIIKESQPKTFITRIRGFLQALTVNLLLIPIKTLFWPFWIMNIWIDLRSPTKTGSQKCFMVCLGLVLTIIYNFIIVIMGLLIITSGGSTATLIFLVCLALLLLAPWSVKLIMGIKESIGRCLNPSAYKKRWQTRDATNFTYTAASPTDSGEYECR